MKLFSRILLTLSFLVLVHAAFSQAKRKVEDLSDEEISTLIEGQYQRAIQILEENKEKLNQLADILIEKEVIFKDDLEAIFGKRSFDENLEEVVS